MYGDDVIKKNIHQNLLY